MKRIGSGLPARAESEWEVEAESMRSKAKAVSANNVEIDSPEGSDLSEESDDVEELDESEHDSDGLSDAGGVLEAWSLHELGGPDIDELGQLCLPNGARALCRGQKHQRWRRRVEVSKRADFAALDAMLAQKAAELAIRRAHWIGVAKAAEKQHEFAPRRDLFVASHFEGGCRMNNERGHQCHGQGKCHQNAPVHGQPKKHGGKLAKWSSSPAKTL